MKKISLFLTLVLFSVSITFAQENSNKKVVVDQVAAVVGKNIIKLSDIENGYAQIRLQRGYENAFELRCDIFENLLLDKLMLHQADLDSVVVEEERVDAELDMRIREMLKHYGSKEALEREANKSISDLKDSYRDILRENFMKQQIEQKNTENVKITPKEVSEYFAKASKERIDTIPAEYEVLQIVKNPDVSHEERERVRESLSKLRERIIQGEKFATLAALYSEDPGSAKKGGEVGLFTRGEMVGEFEAISFTLKPGEVSPIIETKFGFHIIQLIERRGDFVNVRHILMMPKVSLFDLQNAKYFLDSITILINKKQYTFEEAAAKFSDDPSKTNGGVITNPYDGSSKMSAKVVKEYLNYNFEKMKEGEITSPIQMKNEELNRDAYRILCLKTKIEEHVANMNDDYNKIYEIALREAKYHKLLKWAEKKIDLTYIRISNDFNDCNFKLNWNKK